MYEKIMEKIKMFFYLIYAKIMCIFAAYKLRLSFKELNGIFLALHRMSKKKLNGKKCR